MELESFSLDCRAGHPRTTPPAAVWPWHLRDRRAYLAPAEPQRGCRGDCPPLGKDTEDHKLEP